MVEKLLGSVSVSENEQVTGKASGDTRGSWPWRQAHVISACLPRRHRLRGAGRRWEAARVAHVAHQGPCLLSGRAAPCPQPSHGAALGTADLGAAAEQVALKALTLFRAISTRRRVVPPTSSTLGSCSEPGTKSSRRPRASWSQSRIRSSNNPPLCPRGLASVGPGVGLPSEVHLPLVT